MPNRAWHAESQSSVLAALGSDPETGLSPELAEHLLRKHGPNELAAKRPDPWWAGFVGQLKEPLMLVLCGAVVVTGFLGEWMDFGAILLVILVNATIGTVQESKSERAMAALMDLTPALATVIRAGHPTRLPARELVQGDIVVLQAGDRVPADMRVLRSYSLRTDEAALTGEPHSVDKSAAPVREASILAERTGMVYAGTSVSYGRGQCVVVATGMETEVGRIAELLSDQDPTASPLQEELARVARGLTLIVGVLVGIFFAVGIARGQAFIDIFLMSISLAVAAIPEGLPTVVTVVLALGVQRMAHRKALVRKLMAVETLGSATFVCTDKTGTLTQNRMKVTRVWADGGDTAHLLLGAFLCNDATLSIAGSPATGQPRTGGAGAQTDATEVALTEAAMDGGVSRAALQHYPRVGELPFDSERKRMTTVHEDASGHFLSFTKGAPDLIAPLCTGHRRGGVTEPMTAEKRAEIASTVSSQSSAGLRVLAVAERRFSVMPAIGAVESDLVFVGLMGLADPPRPEVREAVRLCKKAGITPVMMTGDHVGTAMAIGKEIGMLVGDEVALEGWQVEAMSEEELEQAMAKTRVFARVAPEHKYRIVGALQNRGEVVAMTGDGVNDGPALKRADIGIAMGITGTDVAKGAAAMTLADDNFATIVSAIEEGRTIYGNIERAVHFLLSCNFGEIAAVFGGVMAGFGSPLTAVQILWVNLITDTAPALGLGVEPPEPGIMNRSPRRIDEGILNARKLALTIFLGLAVGLLTLAAYAFVLRSTDSKQAASTAAFATLGLIQFVQALNMRSSERPLYAMRPFSNPTLTGGMILSAALHLAALTLPLFRPVFDTVPLSASSWWTVAVASLAIIPVAEVAKAYTRSQTRKKSAAMG